MKSIASFLNAEEFLPHGYCLLWRPEILWLHVLSDAGIAFAYYAIPIALFYFINKRGDLPHEKIFWLLGAFILLCGTTHLASIWVLWKPYFGIEGIIKAATAAVSIATLIVSIQLLPRALLIPSSAQLARLNEELTHTMREREEAQQDLKTAYSEMEATVAERTAELRETLARVVKLNAELEQFAYVTSHDLREPLRGLSFHADVLLKDYKDKLDDAAVRHLKRLVHIPARMEMMINELYKLARLGREELVLKTTDLNSVLEEIEDTLEVQIQQSKAQIVKATRLPSVVCDRVWVSRVFYNLLVNAIKYNEEAKPVIEVGCLHKSLEPGRPAENVFYVRDNGIGIDPEFHELVFDIFKRARPEDADKKGTGLGLSFVRKIVERHGGRIWLESAPGVGTTFFFTLERPPIQAAA